MLGFGYCLLTSLMLLMASEIPTLIFSNEDEVFPTARMISSLSLGPDNLCVCLVSSSKRTITYERVTHSRPTKASISSKLALILRIKEQRQVRNQDKDLNHLGLNDLLFYFIRF